MKARLFVPLILFCAAVMVLAACAGLLSRGSASNPGTPEEWITINKDHSSQRYVALQQITSGNVHALKTRCEIRLNEVGFFSSGLLMVDRTLFVTTFRATYAIDAATCELRWRNVTHVGPALNFANRGPGYLDGMIFRAKGDGRVIGLDAKTGRVIWDERYADPSKLESFVAAPIAWDGKVFIGIAQGDLGIRGRMLALDTRTGKELWRFHTVPDPGDRTWGPAKPAGGGFWGTFSLDPATREVFGPVGNPAPDFDKDARPGDNFYTNSVIVLNAATGQLNWHHQQTPRDEHDWDVGAAPTLYRSKSGRALMAVAGKDGHVVAVDRTTRQTVFRTAVTTIANTGPLTDTLTLVCPGPGGGVQFTGAAYQPDLGTLFVGSVDWCSYYVKPKPGQPELETAFPDFAVQPKGWITAIDGETGRVLWRHRMDAQVLAGVVATKSGLVFAGDVRGNLFAFDGRSGAVLTHIPLGSALNGGLISYAVDGTQYVAAAVGGITLNPRGVSGPLGVRIFGVGGGDAPRIVELDRVPASGTGVSASAEKFVLACAQCHGGTGQGGLYPSLARYTQLGDSEMLKAFLSGVPPPMPVLYPGLLTDADVQEIAAFLKSSVIEQGGPSGPYVQPTSAGSSQWQTIYLVVTHPRCMNCHALGDSPRQTDHRFPHVFRVLKGPDDRGVAMKRCSACHGIANDPATGIPGRIDWHAAPASMTSESKPGVPKTGAELCADMKDRSKNGGRNLAELLHFVETDPFIMWAWDPGTRPNGAARTTPPPPTYYDFVKTFREWIDAGAPCPAG